MVAPILGLWVTNVNLSRRDLARAGAESQTKGELFLDFLAIGQEMQMRQNSEECLTNSGPARGNLLFFNQEFFSPQECPKPKRGAWELLAILGRIISSVNPITISIVPRIIISE